MISSFLILGLLFPINLPSVPLNFGQMYSQNQPENSPFENNQDFKFTWTGCNRVSSSIKCDFIIQNNKQDRGIVIYGKYGKMSSRLIDESGNEVIATGVTIGQKTNRAYVGATMLQDVPVKASITFDGFATKKIRVIAISAQNDDHNSGNYQMFLVKFQNK